MSYHTNIVRLRAVSNSLGEWKDKVIFVGGATVSLYATRPLATSVRPTDDVDVVVELISMGDFYKLQEHLLKLGFKNDTESNIISRFLLHGLKVDFMPTDPSILGFSNKWYIDGVKNAIVYEMTNGESIRIFTSPYFIASKMEAFKTRGKSDLYGSHDLEDIVFVLDNRDSIAEELFASEKNVKDYLKTEFNTLLKNNNFEEALLGHVEQSGQTERKNRIADILKGFVKNER
jgi:predicted nucleotidyltransferase